MPHQIHRSSFSAAIALPIPGGRFGNYPERPVITVQPLHKKIIDFCDDGFSSMQHRLNSVVPKQFSNTSLPEKISRCWSTWPVSDTVAYSTKLRSLRAQLSAKGLVEDLQFQVLCAVTRCVVDVTGLTPHETQFEAASALLNNQLVEMATGEGKTLAVFLAAASAALAGVPVHVLTANAYLAVRDQELMSACVDRLGLSSGTIKTQMNRNQRAAIYQRAIVYATASELIFDYLNDRADARQGRPRVLHGLCMAIVDEADSVLLDEARTPFVLAFIKNDHQLNQQLEQALVLAKGLDIQADLTIDPVAKRASLTPSGRKKIAQNCLSLDGLWSSSERYRHEFVERALCALFVMKREVDYVVSDNEIQIVDQNTGRVAQGRRWSMGLHQLIEMKEGFAASGDQITKAQLTFQRFFPRYHRLCGISGTLLESAPELRKIYRCSVVAIKPRVPNIRQSQSPVVYQSSSLRLDALIKRVKFIRALGRPVLIGTDSVAQSDLIAKALANADVPVTVLNAREHAIESNIIRGAGLPRCVTVTTNMAGRGTDILLNPLVKAAGGLHVVSLQSNSSSRIDRQLAGRCARQGDPGSYEILSSIDDGLLLKYLPVWLSKAAVLMSGHKECLPHLLGKILLATCQIIETKSHKNQRRQMQLADESTENQLSFCGDGA